jgi:indole-3-glycerol phosphate synthase
VLLIVRCLAPPELDALLGACRARGLTPLVEVATDAEAAPRPGTREPSSWGVNARDLDTLAMDPEGASRIVAGLPPGVTRVHLSGVASAQDVRQLAARRLDAALIGEALMRRADPAPLLAEMCAAAG